MYLRLRYSQPLSDLWSTAYKADQPKCHVVHQIYISLQICHITLISKHELVPAWPTRCIHLKTLIPSTYTTYPKLTAPIMNCLNFASWPFDLLSEIKFSTGTSSEDYKSIASTFLDTSPQVSDEATTTILKNEDSNKRNCFRNSLLAKLHNEVVEHCPYGKHQKMHHVHHACCIVRVDLYKRKKISWTISLLFIPITFWLLRAHELLYSFVLNVCNQQMLTAATLSHSTSLFHGFRGRKISSYSTSLILFPSNTIFCGTQD